MGIVTSVFIAMVSGWFIHKFTLSLFTFGEVKKM